MKLTSFMVDPKRLTQFQAIARGYGESPCAVLRRLMIEYIAREQRKQRAQRMSG